MKKIIVFVCNGNIERSVIAESYLNKILREERLASKFIAESYGLQGTQGTAAPLHKKLIEYPEEWKASSQTLKKLKLDIRDHSYQQITPSAVKKASVIIAMDKKSFSLASNSLLKQFPEAKSKIHVFSELTRNHKAIKDPAGNGSFQVHADLIQEICLAIKNKLPVILDWT